MIHLSALTVLGAFVLVMMYFVFTDNYIHKLSVMANVTVVCLLILTIYHMFYYVLSKKNLKHIEKQYQIIKTIGAIYSTNFIFYPDTNTWEGITIPPNVEEHLNGKESLEELMDCLAEECVVERYRAEYRSFTNLETVEERIQEKKSLDMIFLNTSNRWIYASLVPLFFDKKRGHAIMLLARDITEERDQELKQKEKLRLAKEQAERANASKTDFLRRMSHDIRTPINGIRGMVHIAKHSLDNPEKQVECLEKIEEASGFLLELVNDVLDMNKLESGDITLVEEPFDLKRVWEECVTLIEPQAVSAGLQFQYQTPEGTHWHVVGSRLHVRQVLQNIMGNAVKYNREEGSIAVRLREISCDAEKVEFEFVCADTGLGMRKEFQAHAFDAFAQEHTNSRTTFQGTGLGLAIAKELVEQMDGSIGFESEEGKGTTFTIRFRFAMANEKPRQEKKKVSREALKGMQVLLVEDNSLNMEIAEFLLESQDIIVTKAWNGKEAVAQFAKQKVGGFDMIFMDIMMPEMDGLQATELIRAMEREDAKRVPIIAMTANAFADDIQRSREAGMDAHLSKPLEETELFSVIQKYHTN